MGNYAYRSSRGPRSQYGRSNSAPRAKRQHGGQYIHPSKFINKAVEPEAEEVFVPKNSFADFKFDPRLLATLEKRGYTQPTPIQDGTIDAALAGKDVIGLANTGTGKTAAFVLPIIDRLLDQKVYQALIIAPTRELANQIHEEFTAFADGLKLYAAVCVGGANMQRQIKTLQRDPHVVIGTPGRLKDLREQGYLKLEQCDAFVLDEADRMLDMGFLPDIQVLMADLPSPRQSLCFSATISPEINVLLDKLLVDPVTVSVRKGETSAHIEQDIIVAPTKEEKIDKLMGLFKDPDFDKVLVFSQTKYGAQRLAEQLTREKIPAEAIHGNKTQPQRERALQAFKSGRVRVLVATDVAARGLDITGVSHVINFDQPNTYDDYVHRIGRTGRAGKRGIALTFVASAPH